MDMLIRLYGAVPADGSGAGATVDVRKPLAPEHDLVVEWISRHFTPGWASEARVALGNRPPTLFIAIGGEPRELLGFCCHDATARGFVGPIGVAAPARRGGVGAALLRACLNDLRAQGHAYAIAGAVGAPDFFRRVAGATEIENSEPGIYGGMLRAPAP
jgi:GNAT superfamily N-acetyltransferase